MSHQIQFRMQHGSAEKFDSISFSADFISLLDLKLAILEKKKFSKANDFDLIITDADSNKGLNLCYFHP